MNPKFPAILRRFVRIWRRWPRHFVLRTDGVPVELLHVEERDGRRRLVVRLPDGRRLTLRPDEVESRPVLAPLYATLTVALIAAILFGTLDRDPGRFLDLLARVADLLLPVAG